MPDKNKEKPPFIMTSLPNSKSNRLSHNDLRVALNELNRLAELNRSSLNITKKMMMLSQDFALTGDNHDLINERNKAYTHQVLVNTSEINKQCIYLKELLTNIEVTKDVEKAVLSDMADLIEEESRIANEHLSIATDLSRSLDDYSIEKSKILSSVRAMEMGSMQTSIPMQTYVQSANLIIKERTVASIISPNVQSGKGGNASLIDTKTLKTRLQEEFSKNSVSPRRWEVEAMEDKHANRRVTSLDEGGKPIPHQTVDVFSNGSVTAPNLNAANTSEEKIKVAKIMVSIFLAAGNDPKNPVSIQSSDVEMKNALISELKKSGFSIKSPEIHPESPSEEDIKEDNSSRYTP